MKSTGFFFAFFSGIIKAVLILKGATAVASPLSVALKIVVSVGLISGVGRIAYLNSNQKNDLKATEANIRILKQETMDKNHQQAKKKVTVSSYQQAEKIGQVTAKAMQAIQNKSKSQPQALDFKSAEVKTLDRYDSNGSQHRLAYAMPYAVPGTYRVQFSHGGSNSDGQIISAFLFYDQNNQLQYILKCNYNVQSQKFSKPRLVASQNGHAAQEKAQNDLQAAANKKMAAQEKGGAN